MTSDSHDHHAAQQSAGQAVDGPTDIGVERLSKVYAQAILEAADRKHCRHEVIDELSANERRYRELIGRLHEVVVEVDERGM